MKFSFNIVLALSKNLVICYLSWFGLSIVTSCPKRTWRIYKRDVGGGDVGFMKLAPRLKNVLGLSVASFATVASVAWSFFVRFLESHLFWKFLVVHSPNWARTLGPEPQSESLATLATTAKVSKSTRQGAEPGQHEAFCFFVSLVSLWFIWSTNHLKSSPPPHIDIPGILLILSLTFLIVPIVWGHHFKRFWEFTYYL